MRKRKGEKIIEGSTEGDPVPIVNVIRELNNGILKNSSNGESTAEFKEETEAKERVDPISFEEVPVDTISSDVEKLKVNSERRERIAAEEAKKFKWCYLGDVLATIIAVMVFLAFCLAVVTGAAFIISKMLNDQQLSEPDKIFMLMIFAD